jgi:hypothetical protein
MLRGRPTLTMYDAPIAIRRVWPLVLTAAVAALTVSYANAQVSSLPATAPTSLANPNSLAAPIAASPTGGNNLQRHRARVTYTDGLLDVHADNSSLNQILRDICRQTGMTIVGGVADQRIFGNYGPASPTTVLQTLLDGTGTNMLLRENASGGPAELTLTPQTGGPTPPGPNSPSYDVTETEPELPMQPASAQRAAASTQTAVRPAPAPATAVAPTAVAPSNPPVDAGTSPSTPPTMPQPLNNINGSQYNRSPSASTIPTVQSVPTDSLPTPSVAPSATGIVDSPNPPPPGTTTANFLGQTPPDNNPNLPPQPTQPANPNGQKTAQQVYQELLQMQQKQQAPTGQQNPQANPQGSSAPQ